ncbi:MAG TPA: TonB-dependent receptor, partial [Povalibacter sp.]
SISRTRFEELTFAADGGQSICGGFNPFGAGSISPECADYVKVDALNTIEVKQTIAEAVFNGPLFDMPAGQVQAAVGVFYKKDEFAFIADDKLRAETTGAFGLPIRADVAGFNATDNTIGETDSTEVYTEVLFPLLAGMPGAEKLDLTLGYRYADYSTVGGVDSYKAELTYQPVEAFVLRSSYQRAVRAPNIQELYQPQVTNFPSITPPDPCSFTSDQRTGGSGAAVESLCLAQGLPADLIDTFTYNQAQVEGLSGGNPELGEETADTLTVGLVIRSQSDNEWLSGLQVSFDWYSIEIKDAISEVTAETFVERCYNTQYNPDLSADNFYCGFFTRNAFNGEITDAAELQQNIGAIETTGVDMQLDWAIQAGAGTINVNWVVAWLDTWDQQELPGDPFTEYGGTIGTNVGTAFPDWKWSFNAAYTIGGLGLNARWRYVGSMLDESDPTFEVPSVDYFDAGISYGFAGTMEGLTIRAGVTNLTDVEPEIYPSYVQSNTDPSTYDILGRRYFLAASFTF